MPRPGPRRPLVALRLGEEDLAEVDKLAAQSGVNRSEMIRRLIAEAITVRRLAG
jgi:metal-responsive CopG/Arc/MetJ family transcriptional regulator